MRPQISNKQKLLTQKNKWQALADAYAYERLSKKLGWNIRNKKLFFQALTHKSFFQGRDDGYERLEFLGDRVLGLCVSEMVFQHFPEESEGALAQRLSALVCQESLVSIAERLDLTSDILIGFHEEKGLQNIQRAILADSVEALIACLYLDGGLNVARAFIQRELFATMKQDTYPPKDPKSDLQEWTQSQGLPLPKYCEIARTGPQHAPIFEIEVSVIGRENVRAKAASKRLAEREAAEILVAAIRRENMGEPH